jgi:high-affinity iron transporter
MVAVVLAVTREGAEIIVFFQGLTHDGAVLSKAFVSGFIGLMIGVSVGALCYYFLVMVEPWFKRIVPQIVLTLVASGMMIQVAQLLMQANILPSKMALWDSGALLAENSVAGQLAYAVLGYEATPTAIEIIFYLGALVLIPSAILMLRILNPKGMVK